MAERNTGAWMQRVAAWLPWLVLLICVRAALVLAVGDVFFWGEELARGTAAKALIEGVPIPLHELVYNEFEGGSLITELLCVPAFLLLGPNLLAHKLVALLWLLAVFAAGFGLAREVLGARAAQVFALLFALAPGSFQKLSLLNLGSHFGAVLFLVAGMWCLLRLLGKTVPRASDAAWLGVCAGLGSYYSFQGAIFALFALGVLLLRRPAALYGRTGAAGWLGLLLGLAPLFWMISRVGLRVFDVHGPRAESASAVSFVSRQTAFLASIFDGRGALDVAAIVALVLLVCFAAWSVRPAALPDTSRTATRILLAYLLIFLVVYLASDYSQAGIAHWFQFNRLSPVWIVATLLAAVALERAWADQRLRYAAALLVALCALGGALDWKAAMSGGIAQGVRDGLQRTAQFCGYTYFGFFNHLREKRRLDPADEARIWFSFDEPSRAWIESAASASLFHDPLTGFAEGTLFVSQFAPQGWRGLGSAWIRAHPGDARSYVRSALEAPLESRAALLEAIGRAAPNPLRLAEALSSMREEYSGRPEQAACLDSLAFGIGCKLFENPGEERQPYFERQASAWCLNQPAFEAWCESLAATPADRAQLRAGYRSVVAERIGERFTTR